MRIFKVKVDGRYKSAVELRILGTCTIQWLADKFHPYIILGFISSLCELIKPKIKINGKNFPHRHVVTIFKCPSPAGGDPTREGYMLQSRDGITVENNMHDCCDTNTI